MNIMLVSEFEFWGDFANKKRSIKIRYIRVVPELEILTILPDLTTKFTRTVKKCGNKIY